MDLKEKERVLIADLIELYRDFPCLWDVSSNSYKNTYQRKMAWEVLVERYKEFDSSVNEASVRKKIDNLKTSYRREVNKVKKSKNSTDSDASDVHKPSLWYFKLMSFLDKNEENISEVDPLMSKDKDVILCTNLEPQINRTKRKQLINKRNLELKKDKSIDTSQELLKTDTKPELNPFGVYVGKKIEEISSGQQRDLAEKLISEIIFLAKTDSLTFDTKIEIPSGRHHSLNNFAQHNNYHFVPVSAQNSQSRRSSSDNSSSYYNVTVQSPPPSSHTHHDPRSSLAHPPHSHTSHSPDQVQSPPPYSTETEVSYAEVPAGDILKVMLLKK